MDDLCAKQCKFDPNTFFGSSSCGVFDIVPSLGPDSAWRPEVNETNQTTLNPLKHKSLSCSTNKITMGTIKKI